MPSEIEYVISQYRASVSAQDTLAVGALTQQYLKVEQGVQRDMQALAAEIHRRELNGEEVTEQMLWGMGSYQRTLANLEKLCSDYERDAANIIGRTQLDAGWLGVSQANDVIAAMFSTNGLAPVNWERINISAVENMVATINRETPWYNKLYNVYGADVVNLRNAMVDSLARGYSEVVMAEKMRDALDIGLNKSILISETEMARAYRTGTISQYQESGVVTGYKRLVKKETACLACLVLDGEHYDVVEEMEDHPRGYCDVIAEIPGVPDPDWEKGTDWLEHQSEDRQREIMGDTRYELWQNGTPLDSMATKIHDPFYGDQPAITKLWDTPGYGRWHAEQREIKEREQEQAAMARAAASPVKQNVRYNGGALPTYGVDGATLQNRREHWRERLIANEGMSPTQADVYIKQAEERLEKIANMGTPTVRVNEYAFNRITKDGRFKTQFETQHSNGYLAPDYRSSAELKGLGAPRNLDPTHRPIYGYLEAPNDEWGSKWGVDQYGDIKMILDRDAVANRAYFTLGDSLGGFDAENFIATPLTKPSVEALESTAQLLARSDAEFFQSFYGYAEMQIKDGVTLADLAEISIPESKRTYFETTFPTTLREMRDLGIRITWYK